MSINGFVSAGWNILLVNSCQCLSSFSWTTSTSPSAIPPLGFDLLDARLQGYFNSSLAFIHRATSDVRVTVRKYRLKDTQLRWWVCRRTIVDRRTRDAFRSRANGCPSRAGLLMSPLRLSFCPNVQTTKKNIIPTAAELVLCIHHCPVSPLSLYILFQDSLNNVAELKHEWRIFVSCR